MRNVVIDGEISLTNVIEGEPTVILRDTARNYNVLVNRPIIGGVTVEGSKTLSDYGLMDELADTLTDVEGLQDDVIGLSTALNDKVDKVTGKGLSTNDFTDADKAKLNGIGPGAEANVNADWNAVSGDAEILNKPTIPSKTSDLTNDSGFINAAQAASAAPVQSVNGMTGDVTIQAAIYTAGAGIDITNDVISVSYPNADTSAY